MFSIILPVYNGEQYLEEALKSIFSQSMSDWELIIINDGSRDNTQNILLRYSVFDNVHIINQKNQGVSAARNNGIAIAKEKYLVFLDADDVWHENHLEVMKNLIFKYPEAGLYAAFTRTELVNGDTITKCNFFKNRGEDVFVEDFFEQYYLDKSAKMFTLITTCISMEAFKKTGGFPERCKIGEDLELSLRVAAYYPVVLSKQATATYKKANSNATKEQSFDPDWGFFDTVNDLYKDESIPLTKRENLKKVMAWFTMRRCRHYIINGQKKKAFKAFKDTQKSAVQKKDLMINMMLLMIPSKIVRWIFKIRWKSRA